MSARPVAAVVRPGVRPQCYDERVAHASPARPSFDELYRQIAALPTGITGEVLERGVLRTMSRPGRPHRVAALRALRGLDDFNGDLGGSGWWIEVEAEVRLLDDYLAVPDLACWRVERVPEMPDENPLTIAPDWVCEVLSPTTARDDRRLKLPLYARAGIEWIWLIDAESAQVEIYETVRRRATFAFATAQTAALPPFERDFDVAAWFATPNAPAAPSEPKPTEAAGPARAKRSKPRRA